LAEWWTVRGAGDWRATFGHLALDYFTEVDPVRLESLPRTVWEKWAPVLLCFTTNCQEVEARGRRLAALCHAAIPGVMAARIRERLRMLVSSDSHHVQFRQILKGLWDDAIAEAVAETVVHPTIDAFSLNEGMVLLLEHGHLSGRALLRDAIEGKEVANRRVSILAAGLRHDHGRQWQNLWALLTSDPTLGRQVLDSATGESFLTEMTALSPRDWADLYLFLHSADPPVAPGADYVRIRSRPPWFLDLVINHLISQGTEEACQALAHIRDSRPNMDWVSTAMIQCREILRASAWHAPAPRELLSMIEDSDRRFVRDGRDLLEVVMGSLARYQKTLPIEDLWNTRPSHTPKLEKALSNHIIRHLRRDLHARALVANREVEIDSFGTGAETERVDILVEAFIGERKEDVVRTVIEVKGCWNKDLLTSMQTQLSDRYLTNNGIHYGIYLVGWFLCPVWKEPDSGRQTMARKWCLDIEAARNEFTRQGASLSHEGRHLSAFVLDARWPERTATPSAAKRSAPAPRRAPMTRGRSTQP
jgi:hypothetical protein